MSPLARRAATGIATMSVAVNRRDVRINSPAADQPAANAKVAHAAAAA